MDCLQASSRLIFGTERYHWSYRPLTSLFSFCALCCLPLVQRSFGGGGSPPHTSMPSPPPHIYAQPPPHIYAQPPPHIYAQPPPHIYAQPPPHIYAQPPPHIYAQPSGLTSAWHLKYAVTPQTPQANAHQHTPNVIVGAVLNVQPLLRGFGGGMPPEHHRLGHGGRVCQGIPGPPFCARCTLPCPRISGRMPRMTGTAPPQRGCRAACGLPRTSNAISFRLRRWVKRHAVRAAGVDIIVTTLPRCG